MRKFIVLTSFVGLLAVFMLILHPIVVRADWDQSNPYTKWVQLPDLNNGMNVNATYLYDITQPGSPPIYPWQKILAEDFPCWQTGPITDIHIWGSWLNDRVAPKTDFKLSIHADVPADVDA